MIYCNQLWIQSLTDQLHCITYNERIMLSLILCGCSFLRIITILSEVPTSQNKEFRQKIIESSNKSNIILKPEKGFKGRVLGIQSLTEWAQILGTDYFGPELFKNSFNFFLRFQLQQFCWTSYWLSVFGRFWYRSNTFFLCFSKMYSMFF